MVDSVGNDVQTRPPDLVANGAPSVAARCAVLGSAQFQKLERHRLTPTPSTPHADAVSVTDGPTLSEP